MELIYELRKICGHDSQSVEGCVTCAAADEIDRLKGALEESKRGWSEHSNICREYERQLAEARAEIKEWVCNSCRTVYPGPPQEGFACVQCPKCSGNTMPRTRWEVKQARQEAARECYEIGNKLLRQGYVTTVISKYMYDIQAKFGLEG